MRILKQSLSAKSVKRGTLWALGFFEKILLQNFEKNEEGTFRDNKKIFEEKLTPPKTHTGFVCYV